MFISKLETHNKIREREREDKFNYLNNSLVCTKFFNGPEEPFIPVRAAFTVFGNCWWWWWFLLLSTR